MTGQISICNLDSTITFPIIILNLGVSSKISIMILSFIEGGNAADSSASFNQIPSIWLSLLRVSEVLMPIAHNKCHVYKLYLNSFTFHSIFRPKRWLPKFPQLKRTRSGSQDAQFSSFSYFNQQLFYALLSMTLSIFIALNLVQIPMIIRNLRNT